MAKKVPWGLWKGRESKVFYIRYTGTPKGRRKATFFLDIWQWHNFRIEIFFARKNLKKLIPYSKTEEKTLSQESHTERARQRVNKKRVFKSIRKLTVYFTVNILRVLFSLSPSRWVLQYNILQRLRFKYHGKVEFSN